MAQLVFPLAAAGGGDDAISLPDLGILQPACHVRPAETTFRAFENSASVDVAVRGRGRRVVRRAVHPGGRELRVVTPGGASTWSFLQDTKPQTVRARLRVRFGVGVGGAGDCRALRMRLALATRPR